MKQRTITRLASLFAAVVLLTAYAPAVHAASEEELLAATDAGVLYLADQQKPNGEIDGFGGETDWTVIAVVADGVDPNTVVSDGGTSLVDALKNDQMDATNSATDVERRILAVAAIDEDTTDFGGVNYNQLLADKHTGGQIGDPTLVNDDTFGIMAVAVTEDETLKPMAQDAVNYLLANQETNGGFSWAALSNPGYSGPDSNSTAAAIVALQTAKDIGLTAVPLNDSVDDAVVYLLSLQHASGGFLYNTSPWSTDPDVGSTSWALMALNTFGDLYATQRDAARMWLLGAQNLDGGFPYMPGFDLDSDTFNTPSAVIALLGTSWTLRPLPFWVKEAAPVAPSQPTTPAVVTPSAAPAATTVPIVLATTSPVTPTPAATEAVQGSTVSTPQTSATATTAPVAQQNDPKSQSNAGRTIGFILIALAVLGFVGYGIRSRMGQQA